MHYFTNFYHISSLILQHSRLCTDAKCEPHALLLPNCLLSWSWQSFCSSRWTISRSARFTSEQRFSCRVLRYRQFYSSVSPYDCLSVSRIICGHIDVAQQSRAQERRFSSCYKSWIKRPSVTWLRRHNLAPKNPLLSDTHFNMYLGL